MVSAACALFLCATIRLASAGGPPPFSFTEPSTFRIGKERFNLATEKGRSAFRRRAEELVARPTVEKESAADSANANFFWKRDRRGLEWMVSLAKRCSLEGSTEDQAAAERDLFEVASAVSNNHRPPVPRYVGLPDFPFRLLAALRNPVAKGTRAASNLGPEGQPHASEADPVDSTYWQRPRGIPEMDLLAGFGRAELPRFDDCVWSYAGPKTAGRNPGCELVCASRRIKLKFAETHSEPFISRIFFALGYHVDPTDFATGLKLRYDRRFFTEFNRRPEITMSIGVFFIPIYTFHFERTYDPFDFVESVVFKDGRSVSGQEFKKLVLHHPGKGAPESASFRPEIESQVDHLVTGEVNVQIERRGSHSIGPWDFGGLGRENLREVRGAGVLAAWLGWWDARFENTRLRIVKTSRGKELRHFFTDLGAGLGSSGGTFSHSSERPEDLPWSFTRANGRGSEHRRFEIVHYQPINETPAFKQITRDDARWMARLIGQLTEDQITSALAAAGFATADLRTYTEKLLARRDQMLRDLDLEQKIPLLRPNGSNSQVSSGGQPPNLDRAHDAPR